VAVQAQLAALATATVPFAFFALYDFVPGLTVTVHDVVPACVTVNVWPPIVRAAVRELVDVLTATLNDTVPGPLPLAPAVGVSHTALLVVVQAQPAGAVTVTDPVPATAVNDWLAAEMVKVHGVPACVTVTVWPAMVRLAVRVVWPVFAVAAKVSVLVPLPLPPAVTVSQLALLEEVQAHPDAAVTVTVPPPAAAESDWLVDERANVHGVFAWVTVNVCPAIVRAAVRAVVPVLVVTLKVSVLVPLPLPPEVTVSQLALLEEVQAQPDGAVTVTVPVPPATANAWLVAEMV